MRFIGAVSGASGAFQSPSGLLPPALRAVYLQPSATGLQFELASADSGDPVDTTAARGAYLEGPNKLNGPFLLPAGGAPSRVLVYNSAGGNVSVRVYGAPSS